MIALSGLCEAVPAQEGTRPAVKRVLVGDGCRLVMFTFRAGQELREHSAAFPIIVQALSGELVFDSAGQSAELVPGSIVHVPARERHAVRAASDATMLLTMLDPDARLGEDAQTTVLPDA